MVLIFSYPFWIFFLSPFVPLGRKSLISCFALTSVLTVDGIGNRDMKYAGMLMTTSWLFISFYSCYWLWLRRVVPSSAVDTSLLGRGELFYTNVWTNFNQSHLLKNKFVTGLRAGWEVSVASLDWAPDFWLTWCRVGIFGWCHMLVSCIPRFLCLIKSD